MLSGIQTAFERLLLRFGYVRASVEPGVEFATPGKRNVMRRRQPLVEGYIRSKAVTAPRPCSVRDMSHFGGRIDLWDDIPRAKLLEGLTLYLPCDGKEVDCELAWIKGRSLGLRFRSGFHEPTRSY